MPQPNLPPSWSRREEDWAGPDWPLDQVNTIESFVPPWASPKVTPLGNLVASLRSSRRVTDAELQHAPFDVAHDSVAKELMKGSKGVSEGAEEPLLLQVDVADVKDDLKESFKSSRGVGVCVEELVCLQQAAAPLDVPGVKETLTSSGGVSHTTVSECAQGLVLLQRAAAQLECSPARRHDLEVCVCVYVCVCLFVWCRGRDWICE